MRLYPLALTALVAASLSVSCAQTQAAPNDTTRVPVTFSGGHATDPRDKGRPVVLIAAALGVPTEVFREAFTHVHPADPGRGPTGDEARANKRALLDALAPYGVTNDRLDEVSNYYRYDRSRGEMWPTQDAVAYALVKNGKVTGFEVVSSGSGYSSPPQITIPNRDLSVTTELSWSKTFEKNGALSKITLPKPTK